MMNNLHKMHHTRRHYSVAWVLKKIPAMILGGSGWQ